MRDKADALEPSFLHRQDDGSNALVLRIDITPDVGFGHIVLVDVLDAAHGFDLILELLDSTLE